MDAVDAADPKENFGGVVMADAVVDVEAVGLETKPKDDDDAVFLSEALALAVVVGGDLPKLKVDFGDVVAPTEGAAANGSFVGFDAEVVPKLNADFAPVAAVEAVVITLVVAADLKVKSGVLNGGCCC